MTPLVTIVVVSYNHSNYIKENLDSIKSQTYPNIQLIVADDASPDHSVEVFDSWLSENNYPALKNYHTKNTGLATTLNECIALAEGKYIKLIAADDFLHPECIEKSVDKLEELGEEYGMVFTDCYAIDDHSNFLDDIADFNTLGKVDKEAFRDNLIKSNPIAALTVMMCTEALKLTGPYDSRFIIEDYYRWLKINEKFWISYIPEKLAFYRQHSENISKLKKNRIELEDIWLKIKFDKKGINKNLINSYISQSFREKKKLPQEMIADYNAYPFQIKRLTLAINYNIPRNLYFFINKIL